MMKLPQADLYNSDADAAAAADDDDDDVLDADAHCADEERLWYGSWASLLFSLILSSSVYVSVCSSGGSKILE